MPACSSRDLHASDRPEVAVAEARAALDAFEGLEAARDADAAAALVRELGGPARTGPRRRTTLTRREAEVLDLVALGLSNPEIGVRLYISRKTAEHHVSQILGKLGLRNRAEAAAYASARRQPGRRRIGDLPDARARPVCEAIEGDMTTHYDVIVVGARCAGSPTAMLLARKGYRVLLVDRATFPSDTMSTHLDPAAGRRRARSAGGCSTGSSRPAARRSTPTRSTSARSRSPARRGDRRTSPMAYAPAADRARQDAGRCRRRGRRRGPRGLHGRRASWSRTGASPASAATARTARPSPSARAIVDRRRRAALAGGRARRRRAYNEQPPLQCGYYAYWSGLPDGRPLRDLHPRRPGLRPRSPPTTT